MRPTEFHTVPAGSSIQPVLRLFLHPFSLLCLFALLPLLLAAQEPPGSDDTPGRTVLTADDLREAGVTRLHEIFLLLDHWSGYTINGQDWQAAAIGLSGYEESGWIVLIDGHPFSISAPGWHSFNHLPVALLEIEQVIAIDTPGLYNGRFTDRGLIHIITTKQKTGWSADLRFAAGNEINDPGPYEYTPLRSPNEERLGPDTDLVVGYRSEQWYLQGSGSVMRHRSTDTPIEQRIKEMLRLSDVDFEEPTNFKQAFHLGGGYRTDATSVHLRTGGLRHRELPFIAAWGREMPVLLKSLYAGVEVEQRITTRTRLSLRSSWQELEPGELPNREGFAFNLKESGHSHQASLIRAGEQRDLEAGWIFEAIDAEGRFRQAPEGIRSGSFYGQWSERLHERFRLTGQLHLSRSGGVWNGSSTLRSSWQIAPRQTLRSWISRSSRPSWRSTDLYYWAEEGYQGLSLADIPPIEPLQRDPSHLTATGLEWNLRWADQGEITFYGALFRHRDISLTRHSYHMIHPHQWFAHDGTEIATGQEATLARLGVTIRLQSHPRLKHTFHAGLQSVPAGTSALRETLQEIPAERVRLATSWMPVDGFRLWSHLRLQSAVRWPEFEQVNGEIYSDQQQLVQHTFENRTGPFVNLDAGGSKSLWQERMSLSLIIKNLLNNPWRLHPAGADNELTFYIQAELHL